MKPRKRTSGGAARLPSAAHKTTRDAAPSAKRDQKAVTNSGSQRVLTPQPEAFWNSLDLYPKGLEALGKLSNASDTALDILAGLGLGNLRLLAEECHVVKPDDATDRTLAGFLCSECDHATLVHLREFLRRRIEAVDIVFRQQFRRKADGYAANAATLSARGSEKLKSLTKLILLYRHDPRNLIAIHAEAVWQSKPIAFEYQSNRPLPGSAARTIKAHKSELEQSLSRAIGKRSVQFIRSEKSAEDIIVFTFFREFSGVVRNDFRDKYNVHHGCGLILFGLSGDRQRVIVKSGNRDVATAIAEFLESTFDVEMTLLQDELFADYTVEDLRKRVLGDYPATFGVEIIAASFARSTFGGHGPISLGTPYLQTSIRPELQHLDELSLIDIHINTLLVNGMHADIVQGRKMSISNESILLGKILGEIYRLQRNADMPCCASNDEIYGLLHGFEHVIKEKLGCVTEKQFDAFQEIIGRFDVPADERGEPVGFYAIEKELSDRGVDRSTAIRLLEFLKASGHSDHILRHLDTSNAPIETRNIQVEDYDQ